MPTKPVAGKRSHEAQDMVAATLAGVIYQAKLTNRQAKLNIPEHEIVTDVLDLWHTVLDRLKSPGK